MSKPDQNHVDKPPKTDEEIHKEVAEEMPPADDVSGFASEVFLRLISTALPQAHFEREPSFVGRQAIDRLWRHSLQIAEVWARQSVTDTAALCSDVERKKIRIKKFPKGLEKKL